RRIPSPFQTRCLEGVLAAAYLLLNGRDIPRAYQRGLSRFFTREDFLAQSQRVGDTDPCLVEFRLLELVARTVDTVAELGRQRQGGEELGVDILSDHISRVLEHLILF